MGAIFNPRPPAPGATEVENFKNSIITAIGGRPGIRNECWKAKAVSDDQAKAWVARLAELNALYPGSTAGFSPCTAGNDQGYRPLSMQEWYDGYHGIHFTNIDMTPASNTVAAGTPGSWNVSGTQKSGALYGYNFADQATAQNYAQAVVDSGGTATMYQVPLSSSASTGMPAPVTGGKVGSGQYEVIGNAATGTAIASYYADLTSAQNFAASVNSAGGNVHVIDTSTGTTILAGSSTTPNTPPVSGPVSTSPSTPSNIYQATGVAGNGSGVNQYFADQGQAVNYAMSQGGSVRVVDSTNGQVLYAPTYVPPPATQGPPMDPGQVYQNPIIPGEVTQPAQAATTGSSPFAMAALLAVPVGAYLWFKHR